MRNTTFFSQPKITLLSDGELAIFAHYHRQDLFIVDIRDPDEYNTRHIPGAVNIPISTLITNPFSKADKNKSVFFHCESGRRTQRDDVKNAFLRAGFKAVYCLTGGIQQWEQCGLQVERASTLAITTA